MKKVIKALLVLLLAVTSLTISMEKVEAETYDLEGTHPLIWEVDPSPFNFVDPDTAMIYLTVNSPWGKIPAFCVEPRVKSHLGDTYNVQDGSINDEAGEIIISYYESDNPLAGSTAGYQAAQIAIWCKILGVNPSVLTPAAGADVGLANQIIAFAQELYGSHTSITHGTRFLYNGGDAAASYDLTMNPIIYKYNGVIYDRSEKMAVVTTGNNASNLSFNVTVDNGGLVSNGNGGNKSTSLNFGPDSGNGTTFYVYPRNDYDGTTTATIRGEYHYPSLMSYTFASGAYGVGQNMMSVGRTIVPFEYTIRFTADEYEPEIPQALRGKLEFVKTGEGPYSKTESDSGYGETLVTINTDTIYLKDTYLAIYKWNDDGVTFSAIDKIAYGTDENGRIIIDDFELPELDGDGWADVLVCEIYPTEGYGTFTNPTKVYSSDADLWCIDYGFNSATAEDGKVTRVVQEGDEVKSFSVIVNKSDSNGNPEAGAVFGIYNTQTIELGNGSSIEPNSLVGMATTDGSGQAILGTNLPVNQDYKVRELHSPNGVATVKFTYEDEEYDDEVRVRINGQEDMSATYYVEAVNTYVGSISIHKYDGDTNENLAGIEFALKGENYSTSGLTDADGNLIFPEVPYGTYELFEQNAPAEYQSSDREIVTVDASHRALTYNIANYKVPVEDIEVIKKVEGDFTVEREFWFEVNVYKLGTTKELIDTDTQSVKVGPTTNPGELHFYRGMDEEGTFEFEIKELDNDYPGYTKDERIYYYTVEVEKQSNHLVVTREELEVQADESSARQAATKIEFNNKFELEKLPIDIVIEKLVHAEKGTYTGNDRFTFDIAETKDGQPVQNVTTSATPQSTGGVRFDFTEPGVYVLSTSERVNPNTEFAPNSNVYNLTFNIVRQNDELVLAEEPSEVNGGTIVKISDGTYGIKFTNEWEYPYEPEVINIILDKYISGINPATLTNETLFRFNVKEGDDVVATPEITGNMFDSTGKAELVISTTPISDPKTFTLTIEEIPGNNANWNYSQDIWTIDVTIEEVDEPIKRLEASADIYKNGILQGSQGPDYCQVNPDYIDIPGVAYDACVNPLELTVMFANKYTIPDGDYEVDKIHVLKHTDVELKSTEKFAFQIEKSRKVDGEWTDYEDGGVVYWDDSLDELVSLVASNVGEFRYRISEIDTGLEEWTYDDTVFTVEFKAIQDGEDIIFGGKTITDQNGQERDTVEFTNTYTPIPEIKTLRTIQVVKKANIDSDLEFEYTVKRDNGTPVPKTIKVGQTNNQLVDAFQEGTFTMEFKETDLGVDGWSFDTTKYLYEFTVERNLETRELRIVDEKFYINGVLSGKTGSDVVVEFDNYYGIRPLEAKLKLTKNVVGTALTDKFEFEMTDTDPITIEGAGSIVITKKFEEAGTFTYQVSEKDLGYKDYTFDDAVYEVTYVVKEGVGRYELESMTVTKNGEPYEMDDNGLIFTNKKEYQPVSAKVTIKKNWNLDDATALALATFYSAPGANITNPSIAGNGTAQITYTFDKPGTYGFEIYELDESSSRMTFDKEKKLVTFQVTESKDGLVVTPSTQTVEFNNIYDYDYARALVPVKKKIEGDFPENKTFIIQIDGVDKMKISGEGSNTYYRDYKQPGQYELTVSEKDMGYANYTFDKSIYTVHINIVKDGLELKPLITITNEAGQVVDEIVFKNKYTKDNVPTDPVTPKERCEAMGSNYKWNNEKEVCEQKHKEPKTSIE